MLVLHNYLLDYIVALYVVIETMEFAKETEIAVTNPLTANDSEDVEN